jgi:feruloyl esterase
MALMEAQRYPEDYDAIIAGAPVYTLQVQTSAVLRNMTFAKGQGGLSADDLKLAQKAVLEACDSADGVEDGLINDPRQCTWDPAELQCSGAKNATCLAAPQVAALKAVYDGSKTPDGEWAMFPMSRGGEAGWSLFVGTDGAGNDPSGGGGLKNLSPLFFGDREVDFASFTMGDVQAVRGSAFAQMYEAKNPDLSAFFGRGGKLLLWHGENDPGPSPVGTNDYARAVLAGNEGAAQSMRYFLMPGVEHCRGGPGADQVELLDALAAWDETGAAPERLIGKHSGEDRALTRPHCAWPNVARYKGDGDANDPASWQCVPRAS